MKYFVKFGLVFVFASFAFAGCPSNKARAPREYKIEGSKVYEASLFRQNCAICHGPEGNGKTVNGQKVPSLRIGEPATRTEEEIYKQIAFGKLPMPSFKDQMTETEMRNMARFIKRELQGRKE